MRFNLEVADTEDFNEHHQRHLRTSSGYIRSKSSTQKQFENNVATRVYLACAVLTKKSRDVKCLPCPEMLVVLALEPSGNVLLYRLWLSSIYLADFFALTKRVWITYNVNVQFPVPHTSDKNRIVMLHSKIAIG